MFIGFLLSFHCMCAGAAFTAMLIADRFGAVLGAVTGWSNGKVEPIWKIVLMACVWEIFVVAALANTIKEKVRGW